MKPTMHIAAAVMALAVVQGCSCLQKDVTINLNPDPVITITSGDSTSGVTANPISVSPGIAGSDYTDNKDKIDKAVLESMEIETSLLYADNQGGQLTSATVTLTNTRSSASHKSLTLNLSAPLNIKPLGTSNTFTALSPDPADFLLEVLKNDDTFTIAAAGTVDHAPVHIDLKIHLKIKLTVNIL
jgi:hypothetical protein